MTEHEHARGFLKSLGIPRTQIDDASLFRPMWWCVDLVRAYARGWRENVANLVAGASDLEVEDMKIMLRIEFDDVSRWFSELRNDPQRTRDLTIEIQRRTRFAPTEHRVAFRAAVAAAEAAGDDLASVVLSTADEVHMNASNLAAAGVVYLGIAQFEQHLNDKSRRIERLLGMPRSFVFPDD